MENNVASQIRTAFEHLSNKKKKEEHLSNCFRTNEKQIITQLKTLSFSMKPHYIFIFNTLLCAHIH